MDANGVVAAIFDQPNSQLKTTVVNAATVNRAPVHDANWVWSDAYDKATNTLRIVYV